MKMELRKSFQFEAAHLLPLCRRRTNAAAYTDTVSSVEIVVAGECDPKLGWLMDYADIKAAFQADLGKAGPQLSEQNSRPRKSNQRSGRRVDLEKIETETSIAH